MADAAAAAGHAAWLLKAVPGESIVCLQSHAADSGSEPNIAVV